MNDIDVISAVSGGSYTLAWLIDHVISGSASISEILAPESPAIKQVQENPHLVDVTPGNLLIDFVGGIGSSITTVAPNAALAALGHIEPEFGQHGFGYTKDLEGDERVMHANFMVPEVMDGIALDSQQRVSDGKSSQCELGDECYEDSLERCPGSDSCLRADGLTHNVFAGCIGKFPWPSTQERDTSQQLWYVKLGLDRSEIQTYPQVVQKIWRRDAESMGHDGKLDCQGAGLERRCGFPHESTTRQDFTPEEYEAYVALGRHIVEDELFPRLREAEISGGACGGEGP